MELDPSKLVCKPLSCISLRTKKVKKGLNMVKQIGLKKVPPLPVKIGLNHACMLKVMSVDPKKQAKCSRRGIKVGRH